MDNMVHEILKDIELKTGVVADEETLRFFSDGATDSIVFCINEKYLVKKTTTLDLETTIKFLETYDTLSCFQHIICYNKDLSYICLQYSSGEKIDTIDRENILDYISQITEIVKSYQRTDLEGFGYVGEEVENFKEFLEKEALHYESSIAYLNLSKGTLNKALKKIEKHEVPKYLIHGDFGFHNFIILDNKIQVIDPMPVIGDNLYDLYFAVLSNASIAKYLLEDKENIKKILAFAESEDMSYKKALFTVCVYIRLGRCSKYNPGNLQTYIELYNKM